jgi:riboflavin kinase / FMN adenylyltransferase
LYYFLSNYQRYHKYYPMKVIKGLETDCLPFHPSAIAIGVFDGVHLGHQKIIKHLYTTAEKKQLTSIILTFDPHPSNVLEQGKIRLLQTIEQRIQEIKKYNIDVIWIIPFTHEFAELPRNEFVSRVIIEKSNAKEIIVGTNFFFGKDRKGDINYLYQASLDHPFNVQSIPPVKKEREIVSSSRIRSDLEQGDIKHANLFLGRPYEITGKVIKGRSRGKNLGFPTANIYPENEIVPYGVYITSAILDNVQCPSVTNIGINPTFNHGEIQVESHLIDFEGDLYSQKINLRFLKKIRNEKKFESTQDLSIQIKNDIKTARSYFDRLSDGERLTF